MKVNTQHAEYAANEANWRLLRDFLQGEDAVKAAAEGYLPKPAGRPQDEFDNYVERATFFDATAKTVTAMVGAMFRKEPTITLPAALEYLKDDADGKGTPLAQVAKKAAGEATGMGRVGLLVDFPSLPVTPKSRKEERDLNARAQIYQYTAEEVINWRYRRIGSVMQLVLLVLKEAHETTDPADPFVTNSEDQYRVLRLDDGLLTVELWRERKNAETASEWYVAETAFPRLPGEKPLDFIPFVFLGSQDLTAAVDKSPVLDIARINRAHYRNSADYEDGLFMLGQPTPWITGLSPQYIDAHGGKLIIGSRAAWLLPENAECGLLEMSNNMEALRDAMAEKKDQMAQLGARLFDGKEGNPESAQASHMRQSGEASTLSSIASNVSRGFKQCLDWCALWMNAADAETDFRTNDDFFAVRLDAATLTSLIGAWQSGAITQSTLLEQLVSGEIIADGTDLEAYKAELSEEVVLPDAEGDPDEDEDPDPEQDPT